MSISRQFHLVRRPKGAPVPKDFSLVETPCGDPGPDEVQIEGVILSVDPYMRPRLNADQPLNAPMPGGGIGRVVKSRSDKVREGDLVRHGEGFQDLFNVKGARVSVLAPDPTLPLSVYMHALGGTGLTAYGGLLQTGGLKAEDQVVVSTAGGAVGSVAAQIAKLKGCYVVGVTGSQAKAAWLHDTVGLDAVINYKQEPLGPALAAAAPRGIDLYFENVGGAQLDAALPLMNIHGRIPVCGMISTYNGGGEGVRNLSAIIYKRVRLEGFVASDFSALNDAFVSDMVGWLKNGSIHYQETILDGFERTPEALIGLFEGLNAGKMLVRL